MADPLKSAMMTPLSDIARRQGMRWKKAGGGEAGETAEYEAGEGQGDDDEVEDEPAASADPFPRNGTKPEQERWRRREENRKKSGTKIIPDPLERAMKGQ
jgi:hypothetical protein